MSEDKCPKCGSKLSYTRVIEGRCRYYRYSCGSVKYADGEFSRDAECHLREEINELQSQLATLTAERDELNKGLLALAQAWRKQLAPMSDKYKCGYVDGQHRCAVQVETLLEESEGKR